MKAVEPVVGMPATLFLPEDVELFTVVEVSPNKRRVRIQRGQASPGDGWEDKSDALILTATVRQDGAWRIAATGREVVLGLRRPDSGAE